MAIVKILTAGLSGAMEAVKGTAGTMNVGKGVKETVVMTGYLGAPREKGSDGEYKASAFGRLPIQAALTGEGDKKRYVIDIAGGLRGVLFKKKNKKEDKDPDYTGSVDLGDGTELGLFGRTVKGENGTFISLSTTSEPKARQNQNGGHSAPAPVDNGGFEDDDIPF